MTTETKYIVQEYRREYRRKKWRNSYGQYEFDNLKDAREELRSIKKILGDCAWEDKKNYHVNLRVLEIKTRVFLEDSYTATPCRKPKSK